MEKIDRLGWAAGICIVAYGLRIGIRVTDASVMDQVIGVLPPGWRLATSPVVNNLYSLIVGGPSRQANVRRFNLLYSGPARLARTLELEGALNVLESDLHLYVSAMARRRLFLHAGVVGWAGRAIVIPGRSLSGKTSLVAALLQAGASYYSDEFAVLDVRGRVHPFARPLAVRDETGQSLRKSPGEEFGAATGVAPLPVGLVILTRYRSGARWRPRPLSVGRGVLGLLAHAPAARRRPDFVFPVLRRVLSGPVLLSGARGDAKTMVPSLLGQCAW